jgi:hypothetical protein
MQKKDASKYHYQLLDGQDTWPRNSLECKVFCRRSCGRGTMSKNVNTRPAARTPESCSLQYSVTRLFSVYWQPPSALYSPSCQRVRYVPCESVNVFATYSRWDSHTGITQLRTKMRYTLLTILEFVQIWIKCMHACAWSWRLNNMLMLFWILCQVMNIIRVQDQNLSPSWCHSHGVRKCIRMTIGSQRTRLKVTSIRIQPTERTLVRRS